MTPAPEADLLHVIPSLDSGGAERLLLTLLPRLREAGWRQAVLILGTGGELLGELDSIAGVEYGVAGADPGNPLVLAAAARYARRFTRRRGARIIQGWLYIGNAAASLLAGSYPDARVVWGIHSASVIPAQLNRPSRAALGLARFLIRRISLRRIVYCTGESLVWHRGLGFPEGKGVVIENGIDAARWLDIPALRAGSRERAGIPPERAVVLCMARYAEQKDIPNLLRAFALVKARRDAVLMLMGRGMDTRNRRLLGEVEAAGLGVGSNCVRLLGMQPDPRGHLALADVTVLPSRFGEALPLAVLESLAAGVPVAATDVGGVRGVRKALPAPDFLRVVEPGSPASLAGGILALLADRESGALGAAAERACQCAIAERYALERVAAQYDDLYRRLSG